VYTTGVHTPEEPTPMWLAFLRWRGEGGGGEIPEV